MLNQNILDHFITQDRVPGKIIFQKIWGSHSHNTSTEKSDVDVLVIYAWDWLLACHLDRGPEVIHLDDNNVQCHEARKFASMLLKGNPQTLECLYTGRLYFGSYVWDNLRSNRDLFLTQQAVNQYSGYLRSQLKRLKNNQSVHSTGGKPTEKWLYHALRVGYDGARIALGGRPSVWMEGEELEALMKVRRGERSQEDLLPELEHHLDVMDTFKKDLPEKPPIGVLNEWLEAVRMIPAA
jgi:predicted nucleotidyltransferase